MKIESILSRIILWCISGIIYIFTTYGAYRFFYEYSHLRNIWLLIGVICIMLCGVAVIWFIHYEYDYFRKLREKNKKNLSEISEKKNEEIVKIPEKEIEIRKKDKKILPVEESPSRKKDKKIQKRYQEILMEYKKTMPAREYKKFEEDTKYDILLYDALMVSRDKEGTLLEKIETEKWEFYATTLKKILE